MPGEVVLGPGDIRTGDSSCSPHPPPSGLGVPRHQWLGSPEEGPGAEEVGAIRPGKAPVGDSQCKLTLGQSPLWEPVGPDLGLPKHLGSGGQDGRSWAHPETAGDRVTLLGSLSARQACGRSSASTASLGAADATVSVSPCAIIQLGYADLCGWNHQWLCQDQGRDCFTLQNLGGDSKAPLVRISTCGFGGN